MLVDIAGNPLSSPSRRPVAYWPFERHLQEATQSVEQELRIEDTGWTQLGAAADVLTPLERKQNVRDSRVYYVKDPLGRQSIRLWTDYTFGSGMTLSASEDEKKTQEVLRAFWDSPLNASVLKARGQRKSSDKLLVDGEIFFVLFLGTKGSAILRWIDPLEITEIITDPNDIETVLYYKRVWSDSQGKSDTTYYRSAGNITNEATKDMSGIAVAKTSDGIVFHLTMNTISQRGNPLLLPALDWLFQYRRFLAARVSIMLALTRFAWSLKVKGGQVAVDAQAGKLTVDDDPPEAGALAAMNEGVDLKPIKADTGAKNAYDDARMLRLQVSSATGIPEQYFGDISSGNLATAKTVELPMMKMFQSQQQVWEDFYEEINNVVFAHNGIAPDKMYVDINWPLIAPRDVEAAASAIEKMVKTFPQFAESQEVQQVGLMILGIDDVDVVLKNMGEVIASNPDAKLAKTLRELQQLVKVSGNGKGE